MKKASKGFSLVEMITVITILAILAVSSVSFLIGYQRDADVTATVDGVLATLRYAQSRSITAEGSTTWGVHFDTSGSPHFYAMFLGPNYGGATDITQTALIHNARFSNITINGGGNDVVFSRLTGATSLYGTGSSSQALCVTDNQSPSACKKGITVTSNGRLGTQ